MNKTNRSKVKEKEKEKKQGHWIVWITLGSDPTAHLSTRQQQLKLDCSHGQIPSCKNVKTHTLFVLGFPQMNHF